MIESAQYQNAEQSSISVVFDGKQYSVPASEGNRYYRRLMEWVAEGNTIQPYAAPPPPTNEERIDSAFPQSDTARVIFEAFFELTNRVRALEGNSTITRQQLKEWLKSKLPS